ncbi:hypothetical protein NT04LS_3410, partial [Listeria seeligeri FSL S4-171]
SFLIGNSSSWKLQAGTVTNFSVGQEIDLFADGAVEAIYSGASLITLGEGKTRTKFNKYMNIDILQGNADVVKNTDGEQRIRANSEGSITARITVPNADLAAVLQENENTTLVVNFKV